MKIYRYTVVKTGEVFVGTRIQAEKHFKRAKDTLRAHEHKGILKREVVDETSNYKERRKVNIYRFEYKGEVFEGTNKEAEVHYDIQGHNFTKYINKGEIKREFLKKGYREYVADRRSSPKEKRVLNQLILEKALRKGV